MKKEMNVCDVCKHDLSVATCYICKKDLCRFHTSKIGISIYNPLSRMSNKEILPICLKIELENRYQNSDIKNIFVCKDCSGKISKSLEYIRKGDSIELLKAIINIIEEQAKIEAL